MVVRVKWRLEVPNATLAVSYSQFICTSLNRVLSVLFLVLFLTSCTSLQAQDHLSTLAYPVVEPDPGAEAQLRLTSGNNLTTPRALSKSELASSILPSGSLGNLEVLNRQTRASTRKRASASSGLEDSGTTPMMSALSSSSISSSSSSTTDSSADLLETRDEAIGGKGSRSRRKKRPNVTRREGIDDSLDDDELDEDEELERSAKKRRLFRIRNKNSTTTTSPITSTTIASASTSLGSTTDKPSKKSPNTTTTNDAPLGNLTNNTNNQRQHKQPGQSSSTPISLQDNKKKGGSVAGSSLLDHEYYDDEDDESTTMRTTTEVTPGQKSVATQDGPTKSKLNDTTIQQFNEISNSTNINLSPSSTESSTFVSTTIVSPIRTTSADNSSQTSKESLSSTFFFFFFPPTVGTGGNLSSIGGAPFGLPREQAVLGAGLFSNSSSLNLSSPKAFNLPSDFLNQTRPWSSNIDLSSLPSSIVNANDSMDSNKNFLSNTSILDPSGLLSNTTLNTSSSIEQDKLQSIGKQQLIRLTNDSNNEVKNQSKTPSTGSNNKSNSIEELVRGMDGEHARIQSSVKEYSQSLKHFMVICSVSVVLAVSLVVGLIIFLTK